MAARNHIATLTVLLLTGIPAAARAQFFGVCDAGRPSELRESIEAHQQHVLRLSKKFKDVWYFQGPLPAAGRRAVGLEGVQRFLERLATQGRRPGILFYSYAAETGSVRPAPEEEDRPLRLCTWLVVPAAPSGRIYSHVARLDLAALRRIQPRLRMPQRGAEVVETSAASLDAESAVRQMSEMLLPAPISAAILDHGLETIVVVPVTISLPEPEARRQATAMVAAVGTVPLSLLRIGPSRDKTLVDLASVVIAPGFAGLAEPARAAVAEAPSLPRAVVVGDPSNAAFPPLPGARAEAEEIAAQLGTEALVGPHATESAVLARLRRHAGDVRVIHFATHGIADSANPLDGSFLVVADGALTAREISTLRFAKRPLVVMSACDTGRGRDFEVGTIGLARAWQQAGAGSVVMSLWRVDDAATRELMGQFVRRLAAEPPDKALTLAMRWMRGRKDDPALWAGFAVFGLPEAAPAR